jgi:predicted phosphate transport protein (TIGR00153 family)
LTARDLVQGAAVAFKITPRDTAFYDMFEDAAKHCVEGANLLAQMLGADQEGRKPLAKRFTELEHEADASLAAIINKTNKTFVTPFDRDDILALANAIDDCIDSMEEAADLIVLYKVGELPTRMGEVVQVLQRSAELTVAAMPRLRALDKLDDYWIEIGRQEHQADRLHRKILAQLFDEYANDAVNLIKLKEIADCLEDAADYFEEVSEVVEGIALKES